MSVFHRCLQRMVSIRARSRARDARCVRNVLPSWLFQSARARERATRVIADHGRQYRGFNPRALASARHHQSLAISGATGFQSARARERATASIQCANRFDTSFNPRALASARLQGARGLERIVATFQSARARERATRDSSAWPRNESAFQSARARERATDRQPRSQPRLDVSIRARSRARDAASRP